MCVGCKTEGAYICQKCSLFISEASPICPGCWKETVHGRIHSSCSGSLDGFSCVWEYQGIVAKILQLAKERGIRDAYEEMVARAFFTMANNEEQFSQFFSLLCLPHTGISFVPMDKIEEKKRGYNQAKVISDLIANVLQKESVPLLQRARNPENLQDLMEGPFKAKSVQRFETVVLIDDIWRSGVTMKECAQTLKQAGVRNVWGFTLARNA
ncbi:MAG: ComF family protein [Candidatus Wildermuthbacteria bacterium]|nr:ComF family protein [Candidatus Wildermuthbacteria bacterium]